MLTMKSHRSSANGAFVSVSKDSRPGSVFQEIRRPDGSRVVSLSRDSYDRAITNAKAVLAKKG